MMISIKKSPKASRNISKREKYLQGHILGEFLSESESSFNEVDDTPHLLNIFT